MLLERIMDGETESIDWFGEKQARGSNTLRRTLELEKGKDG